MIPVFPEAHWTVRRPEDAGLAPEALGRLQATLGGRGCVVKDGYVVYDWGDQAERSDWFSSAKPVLSTLLFFAVAEERVPGVDASISPWWPALRGQDVEITFAHLANMVSGYARPEPPGAAWAYNDYAIQLYQKTLFDGVFADDPDRVASDGARLGALQLEHGLMFDRRRRLFASVPDFARVAWLWLQRGQWGDRQLLPSRLFDSYMRPHVPHDLPHTTAAATDDYLGIGTYGGESDHFTRYGAGIYSFNWWFNATGRLHPNSRTWPDAPPDTVMSIGARGNCAVIIPSLNLVLASARGDWGALEAGSRNSTMNRILALLCESAGATSLAIDRQVPLPSDRDCSPDRTTARDPLQVQPESDGWQ
jgi:hypothetical protein